MQQLIECVPNFSEGRDMSIIKKITDEIEKVEGVKLLDVDPGKATNRTVVTFVGEPKAVCEAAFLAVKKASELIDMSKHHGEHPRFGATDVLPLVPVSNITMAETVEYARNLGKRIGEELTIPVYCYESAAFDEKRQNLAYCRAGEYEGLKDKLSKPEGKPDFGPAVFNKTAGATAVGARNFLIAYNINLNTTSTRRANAIAFDVRENGRIMREGDSLTGKVINDANGNPKRVSGSLQKVKAIGWFIDEYGVAQISMNLTDITVTPIHIAFDEVCKKAEERGIRVTGSELVGLIPLQAMLDAGKHYLRKQERSLGISDREIIKIAIKSMGLDEITPFDPDKKIIEYMIDSNSGKKLVDMTITDFTEETASESMAPGGGSVSACIGAMGVALGTMVANLSAHKRGWDDRWEEFSNWAEKGKYYQDALLKMVDEDTNAFNKIIEAVRMPKKTEEEKQVRQVAMDVATKYAIEVPLKVMKLCYESMEVMKAMAEIGNPNSASDAGVGAMAARTGVRGAYLNVKINMGDLKDEAYKKKTIEEAYSIVQKAEEAEKEILQLVEKNL